MTTLRPGVAVRTRVPATSANLGPGFDSLGIALGVTDVCEVTVTEEPGLVIDVEGEGAEGVPRDASHLVHRAMRAAWDQLGVEHPQGLRMRCVNAVPHGRGMGSSATAIVTGVVAAQALSRASAAPAGRLAPLPASDGLVDLDWCNDVAARLEGHPDNSSAAVYGGVTLSWSDDPQVGTRTLRLSPHPDLDPVVLVPAVQLSTATARAVLPAQVRLADAAANSARTALLVQALTRAPEHLLDGTRDWLHQEPRRASYAASMAAVDRLRAGGHAAVISGAGPSVLVLGPADRATEAIALAGEGWRALRPGVPSRGAWVELLT